MSKSRRRRRSTSSARTFEKKGEGDLSLGRSPHQDNKSTGVIEVGSSGSLADWATEINQDIVQKKTKSAVEKAKQIHKQMATGESEALLVGAYFARIQYMLENGLCLEARELLTLVEKRYATARERFRELHFSLNLQTGRLDELAAMLNDPDCFSQNRNFLENAIRQNVADLSSLARCKAFDDNHPLRRGAAALVRALEAVTSGPVADEEILLPEISRRSPLADWKTLVRALAGFYRRDDETCLKLLETLDKDSAAARLIPVIHAMIKPETKPELKASEARLVKLITHDYQTLRDALHRLDQSLVQNDRKGLISTIRQAVRECQKRRPELLERLKQHISVRCALRDISARKVTGILGDPPQRDAYFWRLFARAMEIEHQMGLSCSMWEEFRRSAVQEGWFQDQGPEAAALYLHMIDLLKRLPAELLIEVQQDFEYDFQGYDDILYKKQSSGTRAAAGPFGFKSDLYFLHPEQLYERAAACRADAEIYQQWLEYLESRNVSDKVVESVADRWHKACPQDVRPLLHLMESAERRNAFNKALKFLLQAEQLDKLNPEVKRSRWRLLIAKVMRHLKQRKAHLVEQDLIELAESPLAQEGNHPAFLSALRWAWAALQENRIEMDRYFQETCRLMGHPSAGKVVLIALTQAAQTVGLEPPTLERSALKATKELLPAVARGCAVFEEMGLPFVIPRKWTSYVIDGLKKKQSPLEPFFLQSLTEAALRGNQRELAFAASGVGLHQNEPTHGWFLWLRARSLAGLSYTRMKNCLAAAAKLARRQGDMTLLAKVVDFGRAGGRPGNLPLGYGMINVEDLQIDDRQLALVMETEQKAKKPPKYSPRDYYDEAMDYDYIFNENCQCPEYRRRRAKLDHQKTRKKTKRRPKEFLFDDLFEEEDYEEEYEQDFDEEDSSQFSDSLLPDLPRELQDVLLELIMRSGGRPPDLTDLEKIARQDPDFALRIEQLCAALEARTHPPAPSYPQDESYRPWDFESSSPGYRRADRKERRRKRKKQRKNRRR